jgi:hypothetical protein
MIKISRTLAELPNEARGWYDDAQAAQREVIATATAGDPYSIEKEYYKPAGPFLKKLFSGKCAYCETFIEQNHPGAVEHFRPKGAVSDEDFNVVRIGSGANQINHPGYYWLAYEWLNLLPACYDCNTFRYHGDLKIGAGKNERFPIVAVD